MRRMPLYKILVPIDLLVRIARIPICSQRLPFLLFIPFQLRFSAWCLWIVNGCVERAGYVVRGGDELGQSRIDRGCSRKSTAPLFSDRVGET